MIRGIVVVPVVDELDVTFVDDGNVLCHEGVAVARHGLRRQGHIVGLWVIEIGRAHV